MANFKTADDQSFQSVVMEYKGISVVDFWAPWCAPCRMFEPILAKIQERFEGQGVQVVKVSVDENIELAKQYNVRSIPALMIVKNGQVINFSSGVQNEAQVAARILPYLESP